MYQTSKNISILSLAVARIPNKPDFKNRSDDDDDDDDSDDHGSKCDICHISCPDWSTNMAKIAHFPFLAHGPKCDIFHISCPDLSTIMAKIAHFRFQTSFHKMITCPVLNANMASQMPCGERWNGYIFDHHMHPPVAHLLVILATARAPIYN